MPMTYVLVFLEKELLMRTMPLNQSHIDLLEKCGLSNIEVSKLQLHRFEPGETILQEGTPMDACYLIVKGVAKVYIASENGKSMLISCAISEGFIGEMELLTQSFHSYSRYVAETVFDCIRIPYSDITHAMQDNSIFLNYLVTNLSSKLYLSIQYLLHRVHYTADERLASYILRYCQNGYFTSVLSDVSLCLGISYRHLFRLLDQFCSEGLLEKTPQGYKILNYKGLAKRTSKH